MKKFIPNFITLTNLACGIAGVVFAFKMRIDIALYCMLCASVFDFLDGAAARALGAYSNLGKELDSLCDLVSFGVLPSVMAYLIADEMSSGHWSSYIPLLVAMFSAYRLAKFNIDSRQSSSFLGLPTPACALLLGSISYYFYFDPITAQTLLNPVSICVTTAVLCVLLVCELPMFSMKFHKDDPKALKIKRISFIAIICLCALACALFGINWSAAVIFTFVAYILKNIIYALLKL